MCEETKFCPKCKVEKPKSCFSKSSSKPDGLYYCCKECDSKAQGARHKKNKARDIVVIPEFKTCPGCAITKPSSEFTKAKGRGDGLSIYCKDCLSKRDKANNAKNQARETIITPDFKTCPGCKKEKPGFEFGKSNGKPDGLQICCKECAAIRVRMSRYGITEEQYQAMLKAQGGACAICKFIPGDRKSTRLNSSH